MLGVDELSQFIYKNTGKKIYWHTTSCCHDFLNLWSAKDLKQQPYSTCLGDSDLIVVGAKLGHGELILLKEAINPDFQKVVAFGNCTISGGIFAQGNQIVPVGEYLEPDLIITGCPPRFEAFKAQLLNYLEIGS